MLAFAQAALDGLMIGGVYAVISIGLTLVFGGPATGCTAPVLDTDSAAAAISPPPGGWRPIGTWDADQVTNAATIIEWPERIAAFIPSHAIRLEIKILSEHEREIAIVIPQ